MSNLKVVRLPGKTELNPPRAYGKYEGEHRPVTRAEQDVEVAERRMVVMDLRREGMSYTRIAEVTGLSVSTVSKYIKVELLALRTMTQEDAEDVRDMELIRLDHMLSKLEDGINAGDVQSIGTALKIQERRTRLIGLDAAQKFGVVAGMVNLTPEQVGKMSDEDLRNTMKHLLELAGQARMQISDGQ